MKRIIKLFLAHLLLSSAYANWEPPPEMLVEIRSLESLPPWEAITRYRKYANAEGIKELARASLARNMELIAWLPEYFQETPVMFENLKERQAIVNTVKDLPAEWAVRFLLELFHDERPMKSTRFDYDDPEFQRRMERADVGLDNDMELFLSYGYGPPGGDNHRLARRALNNMSLAGAPGIEDSRSTPTWLRQPSQARRIPAIVKETWGERAILNADLGLGPDNLPIKAGSNPSVRPGLSGADVRPGAGAASADKAESEPVRRGSKLALLVACGLLAAGLATVVWKRVKAG